MPQQPTYGPHNPHPLSQMRTELIWEGKYDEYGNRREVDIAGCAMPMQKIESIDEPRRAAAATGQLELFEQQNPRVDDFRNRLIWGDNKLVMASLLQEFKGKIDLIYIDPPFDVGEDFTMDVPIGEDKDTLEKDQSTLEMVAYRDMWGMNTDSYLHMMYERLTLIRDLLSEKGILYVHCDWHMNYFLRALLNEIFHVDNFLNECIWYYYNKMHDVRKPIFPRSHDTILSYAKQKGGHTFNLQLEKRDKPVTQLVRKKVDGRMVNARDQDGNVLYQQRDERTVDDIWRIPMIQPADKSQNTGYATQKNELILERIIQASSNEGDLVADFFCGSGTTGAVAERLGRRWIMCDLGRFAIHTSRKRLIELQRKLHSEGKPYRAFDVYNLGRYERQWWQKDRLQGADEEHRRVILEFFKAEILTNPPSPLLHGRKAGAFCHVDGIDSIFTREEAKQVAQAVASAGGRECYCLAWEFEMDLHLTVNALVQELGVKLKLVQIPREIMEKNRKAPPPFLEVAVLAAEPVYRSSPLSPSGRGAGGEGLRTVDIKLTQFIPSLAEVPTKELEAIKERAIKSGFDFIDFWAVDFNWQPGKPFTHDWQDYRTRKDRSLKTISDAGYTYPEPGKYTACVKVVDTFGCDTSITVEIDV
ncbi:site-specific DNA-methyltransferase [Parathermosynechococcus lividus PCC 6715]|uniref:Site-specific DNA-methyltransferase n=2 Tax=Parathermosynechococcus lividus TaxID=33070 RepID=A0A2D2Q192_PARLV|nr:site-specific DNA-methyltransferase [Thermostichus lividus PCC 6715]